MKIRLILLFIFTFVMLVPTFAEKQFRSGLPIAHKVYDEYGVWQGTCRRGDSKFELFDLKDKLVKNPAEYLKQSPLECYLFDVKGYAFGKCTANRVIIFSPIK